MLTEVPSVIKLQSCGRVNFFWSIDVITNEMPFLCVNTFLFVWMFIIEGVRVVEFFASRESNEVQALIFFQLTIVVAVLLILFLTKLHYILIVVLRVGRALDIALWA